MPKLYKFGDEKSKHLSDFEADKIISSIPKKFKKKPKDWEMIRTENGVIYQTNRRQKTKNSFKIRRLCALLAKKKDVFYDEKNNIIISGSVAFVIADRVQSDEEFKFHQDKGERLYKDLGIFVISLTKSKLVPYFEMDTKTIKEYYFDKFKFPQWFRKFLKQRAFRVMNITNSFAFSSRRYNDTSKWTAEQKFVNDLVRKNVYGEPGKIYFTLSRMLDSKLDREGKGFPIKGKILLVLDVDGKCNGMHEINKEGICIKCMKEAFRKEKEVKRILLNSKYPMPIKTLFSGGKGLHLHFGIETTQERMKEIIDFVNKKEDLVDYFEDKNGNFDLCRIFKVPKTVSAETACLIDEDITRLNVQDKICEPIRQ